MDAKRRNVPKGLALTTFGVALAPTAQTRPSAKASGKECNFKPLRVSDHHYGLATLAFNLHLLAHLEEPWPELAREALGAGRYLNQT